MKILLLLVLKCLLYLKITGDHIHQSEIRDISLEKFEFGQNDVKEYSNHRCFRVKRDSSIRELSIFESVRIDRSPRRKRAVLRKKNQIFFRRHKKKMERKSKIRKSLMRRGKFTTSKPYRNNMKRYVKGKGKIVRPPGLKYRKRYRFNRFKKTQDVALGMGVDGKAQFKKSAPKKRPPIHVRDYERGRRTRKTFRGRVGERKSPDEERRRTEAKGNRRRGAAEVRVTVQKSKEYYDDSGDYSENSLPKQTKARKSYKTFGKTTKEKKAIKPLEIKDSDYDYNSEDNTLLLSDEEQLTDISSEIEAQRSEFSDERPKHRKNASSSEYEQYNFADDDSAIIKGEIVSSKEESERVSFPRKTTLLGPIKYEQYDINKLDASMERVFNKKKPLPKIEAKLGHDDPWENLEDAYKDESSYDENSEIKENKQKGKKSKTQIKKRQGKLKHLSKKNQEFKTKLSKEQNKAKSETDIEKYSYNESEEYDDNESEEYNKNKSEGNYEDYDDKTASEVNEVNSVDDKVSSEKGHSKRKGLNETEEYYSEELESDEYSTYEETKPPIRRIPTWKITQHSTQDKFYEEYTDIDSEIKSKSNDKIKTELKRSPGKTSTYESEEYYSAGYFHSESSYEDKHKQKKSNKMTKKNYKIKSDPKKNQDISEHISYHNRSKSQKAILSGKLSFKTDKTIKSDSKENQYSSEFSSHYYDTSESSNSRSSNKNHAVKKSPKRGPVQSDTKLKSTIILGEKNSKAAKAETTSKKNSKTKSTPQKNKDSSYYYDSSEYSDSEFQKKYSPKSGSKSQKATFPGKMFSKTDMTIKSDPKENQYSSEFSLQYYDSSDGSESSNSKSSNKNHSTKKSSKRDHFQFDTKLKKSITLGKINTKAETTFEKKSKTKSASKKNQATSEFSSDYYDSKFSNEHHSDQGTQRKDSPPSKKTSEISTDVSYGSDYSDDSDTKPSAISIKAPKKSLKTSSEKKIVFTKKFASEKKSKSGKNKPTPMYESDDYSGHSDEKKDSKIMKSFGLDDDYRKKKLKFSTSEEISMIKFAKAQSLPPIEIVNTKIQGIDIVRAEHEKKYDLSISDSKAGTPIYASYDNVSDYSHDDTEDNRRELKSFGMVDFKVPPTRKITAKKELLEKNIKKKKNLPKQTVLKKSLITTTKKKGKTKKSIGIYESDYDSDITSYEQSSDYVNYSKKSPSETISLNKKDPKQIIEKGHELPNESKDHNFETDYTDKDSKDESLGSYNEENESTKGLKSKTTLTTKRRKKGFTTLPATTKGFDLAEALKNISSKAAAITKKHVFVYNTKKKAYELVRVHSSQP